MHGTMDNVVPMGQSEELAQALRQAGVNVFFQKVVGAGHGPGFDPQKTKRLIQSFFDLHLKNAGVKLEPFYD
jgi:dipeptidyl aminopeptidase/acylaminoacyl peptidase